MKHRQFVQLSVDEAKLEKKQYVKFNEMYERISVDVHVDNTV